MTAEREWRSVLFADLVGTTAAYEKLGNDDARKAVDRHLHALTRITRQHKGEPFKTQGDAVLTCFHSPDDAARAAIQMQHELRVSELAREEQSEITRIAGRSSNTPESGRSLQIQLWISLRLQSWDFDDCAAAACWPIAARSGTHVVGEDGREVFLRRESLPLAGRGVISLGCPLLEQTGETLRYSCE